MTLTPVEDIPRLPDRQHRLAAVLVDCFSGGEELPAFEVYFADALESPFAASWRDPDDPEHEESVTVAGLAQVDDRRGVRLTVRRTGGWERNVLAEQLWATDERSVNATILDDYRHWVGGGGLCPDEPMQGAATLTAGKPGFPETFAVPGGSGVGTGVTFANQVLLRALKDEFASLIVNR